MTQTQLLQDLITSLLNTTGRAAVTPQTLATIYQNILNILRADQSDREEAINAALAAVQQAQTAAGQAQAAADDAKTLLDNFQPATTTGLRPFDYIAKDDESLFVGLTNGAIIYQSGIFKQLSDGKLEPYAPYNVTNTQMKGPFLPGQSASFAAPGIYMLRAKYPSEAHTLYFCTLAPGLTVQDPYTVTFRSLSSILADIETAAQTGGTPKYTINLQGLRSPIEGFDTAINFLTIQGADPLLEAGYVPYLLEYRRKRNNYPRLNEDGGKTRIKGNYTYGWSLYGGDRTLKINPGDNKVYFSDDTDTGRHELSGANGYCQFPRFLEPQYVQSWQYDGDYCYVTRVKGRSKKLTTWYASDQGKAIAFHNAKRRFAIVFAPPIDHSQGTAPFDFSKIVTNIAEFSFVYCWPESTIKNEDYDPTDMPFMYFGV